MRKLLAIIALTLAASSVAVAPAQAVTAPVTIAAAGDIACSPVTSTTCQQAATERVAVSLSPKYLFALGDLAYPQSTLANLNAFYNPSWGKLKSITKPILGNHETTGSGYYDYWAGKGNPQAPTCRSGCLGYYSFDVGSWHVLALNSSSCSESAGTCGNFTHQAAWITADIAAHPNNCTLAIVHHPYWSYGGGATPLAKPLYQALYSGGVDLVLTGHAHRYERFRSQDINGNANPNGLTEIVAGTGGASKAGIGTTPKNRLMAFSDFGILQVSLQDTGWSTSFHSISGAVRDPSTGVCH